MELSFGGEGFETATLGESHEDKPHHGMLDFAVVSDIFWEMCGEDFEDKSKTSNFADFVKYSLLNPEFGLRVIILESSTGVVGESMLFLNSDQISLSNVLLLINKFAQAPKETRLLEKQQFQKIVETIPTEYGLSLIHI